MHGPLNAAKDCAVNSAAKNQLDAASIACRDNYRKAYLAILQSDLKDTSNYQKNGVHVPPLDPKAFPSQLSGAKDNYGTISLAENGTAVQYYISDSVICSDVLEPVTVGSAVDCQFTLPRTSGTLQSTAHTTAYFYLPFDQAGVYLGQDKVPSSYVLGACLESGQLVADEVDNEGHPLYSLTSPNTLQTTGSNPQTIICQ